MQKHLILEFDNRFFAHATGVGRSFAAFGSSCTPGSIHPYCLAGSSSHRQQPPSNQTCHSTGTQVRLNCSSKSCKYVKLQPYIHGCRSMYIHSLVPPDGLGTRLVHTYTYMPQHPRIWTKTWERGYSRVLAEVKYSCGP